MIHWPPGGAGCSAETIPPLLANIALDPLDKELASRGHKFARYADDFIVMVKSANAAKRVMASLIRYCEGRLQLVVNRAKSRAAEILCVPELSAQQQGQAGVDGKGAAPLQGAGEGNHHLDDLIVHYDDTEAGRNFIAAWCQARRIVDSGHGPGGDPRVVPSGRRLWR